VRIGVTMGDPAGIGPELVAAALAACGDPGDLVVFGDRDILLAGARAMGVTLPDFDLVEVTRLVYAPGRPDAASGRAQIDYLERAVAEKLDALVTAPIHKASALAAGFGFPGHTEFLAARYRAPSVTMMLAGPRMRVSLATIHLPLSEVPRALTVDGLTTTILHTAAFLTREARGVPTIVGAAHARRVAVAGLNPHAGESDHFGDEESRIIRPAIAAANQILGDRARQIEITGPHVPDVVFRDHLDGKYDAVVAMYHDQGLIPVKLVDFEEAVNVTLGLPPEKLKVRTSPDHGVAHDIAGTGRARTTSFFAALRLARQLAQGQTPPTAVP
jgi:4-hydroxythreonine-4-phosphate dehydrogenase